MKQIQNILNKNNFSKEDIIILLKANDEDIKLIFEKAKEIKQKYIGNKVYYRGLIEFSNICKKDCFYCGIRKSNTDSNRYEISNNDILSAAKFAFDNRYASIVLQAGERTNNIFIEKIDYLLKEIKKLSNNKLGITISLGEQTEEIYKKWYELGAHRYLLRIETSNQKLYEKLHPNNDLHSYKKRIDSLKTIQNVM